MSRASATSAERRPSGFARSEAELLRLHAPAPLSERKLRDAYLTALLDPDGVCLVSARSLAALCAEAAAARGIAGLLPVALGPDARWGEDESRSDDRRPEEGHGRGRPSHQAATGRAA